MRDFENGRKQLMWVVCFVGMVWLVWVWQERGKSVVVYLMEVFPEERNDGVESVWWKAVLVTVQST